VVCIYHEGNIELQFPRGNVEVDQSLYQHIADGARQAFASEMGELLLYEREGAPPLFCAFSPYMANATRRQPSVEAVGEINCNRCSGSCIYVTDIHQRSITMQEMIPITLFICIAYAIHALADARARGRLVAPHVPEEVIRALADLEEARRRMAGLRWGICLVSLSIALAVLEAIGARDLTFGAAAALVGSAGAGQLVAYAFTRASGVKAGGTSC